jgi:L-lactate dehydrogenase complex protein LldG
VSGRCNVVGCEAEAAATVDRILGERSLRKVAVSDAPLVRALVERLKPGPTLARDADAATLFGCDVGITSAQWAVAETGTLVLVSGAERHRLASLIPPAHIAVVPAACLRRTLPEVLDELVAGEPSRAVTFITGPSRTSDIELTLAIGVHGPGELDVIVLDPTRS